MVTVYTQPGCTQCKSTIRFLSKHNLPHNVVDISEHPTLVDELTRTGRTTLPYVTVTRDENKVDDWSGHNMYKLIELKRATLTV
jgi:glutaredoxin|nr:MAG TPA: glutaredoxin-like protein [Caudoviricetes sp.]